MEKVGRKELCPCKDKDRYHQLGSALEGCFHVHEDNKILLFIEMGRLAYGGYMHNPRPTCIDVEDGILCNSRFYNLHIKRVSFNISISTPRVMPITIIGKYNLPYK